MDPLSAIGAAAGAVQFADVGIRGLKRTVQLLLQLKNAPQRMIELLQDVNRSIEHLNEIRSALRQRDTAFAHLTDSQAQRMKSTVENVQRTIEDIHAALEPRFSKNASTGNWARKTWRSVISVPMEDTIIRSLERVQRLEQELLSEMLFANLQLQRSTGYVGSCYSQESCITDMHLATALFRFKNP